MGAKEEIGMVEGREEEETIGGEEDKRREEVMKERVEEEVPRLTLKELCAAGNKESVDKEEEEKNEEEEEEEEEEQKPKSVCEQPKTGLQLSNVQGLPSVQSATPVQSGEKLDGTTERELEELEEEDAPQKEILWCRHPKRGLQISRVHTLVSLQSAFLLHRGAKLDTVREEESDGENCDNENELRELGTKLCEDTTDGNEAMELMENEEGKEEERNGEEDGEEV